MMGRQAAAPQLFYDFRLEDHVPADHMLRGIARFLDLSSLRAELAPFYSSTGRPSIDPELMIRMLGIGYRMGVRSEHTFFVRIRAKRGLQIAAVALARKLTVLCWHLLTKEEDYLWARSALVTNKMRTMELQAGLPQRKGNRRGASYACNVKELRDRERQLAEQAERSYEHLIENWKTQ